MPKTLSIFVCETFETDQVRKKPKKFFIPKIISAGYVFPMVKEMYRDSALFSRPPTSFFINEQFLMTAGA